MANKKKIKLSGPRPLHTNIGIYNKELGFLDEEDKFHPVCHAVYAPTIRKNLETGVEEVLLEYTSGGAQESRWFPREVVAKRIFLNWLGMGGNLQLLQVLLRPAYG